jgi:hypothetical protein
MGRDTHGCRALAAFGSSLPAFAPQPLLFVGKHPVFPPQKEHYLSQKHFSGRSVFFSLREKKMSQHSVFFLSLYNFFSVGKNRLRGSKNQFLDPEIRLSSDHFFI